MHLIPECPNCLRWLGFAALPWRLWALGMFSLHRGDPGSASWCCSREHCKLFSWNIKSAGKHQGFFFEKVEAPLSRELTVQPYFPLPPSSRAIAYTVSLIDTCWLGPPDSYLPLQHLAEVGSSPQLFSVLQNGLFKTHQCSWTSFSEDLQCYPFFLSRFPKWFPAESSKGQEEVAWPSRSPVGAGNMVFHAISSEKWA